ncbi:hypothetical protein NC99_45450 [Sunxiuqinia dokdonensis]|uniref:Uncharacterized protein n=1 Tax=Sunxiuqinia dokdonensis TaxID=1409788 RepID=A0A0L8V381_9BACT|nr:hypothetical protein NC99_45450 [Sunxiuqinia dokdonensis]
MVSQANRKNLNWPESASCKPPVHRTKKLRYQIYHFHFRNAQPHLCIKPKDFLTDGSHG